MEWIAAAIVFCFLMWKWPRKTIQTALGLLIVSCIASLCFIGHVKYKEYVNKKESIEKQEKEKQAWEDEYNRRLKFGKNIKILRHKNSMDYECKHFIKVHDSHHIFTLSNDNDTDITSFTILLSGKLKGHSSDLFKQKFEYDIIVPAHGTSIPFCINFIENTMLVGRIPQARGDAKDMINRGVEILDYDDIVFEYYVSDAKNGNRYMGGHRLN